MTAVALSAEARDILLHGTRTAKVATIMPDGSPHVAAVWFVLDGEQIVFTTWADSVKGRNLRRDPRVALVVDDGTAPSGSRSSASPSPGDPVRSPGSRSG